MRSISLHFGVLVGTLLLTVASPAFAKPGIERLVDVRFGNHGGVGRVSEAMEGASGATVVVGVADVPDPKRRGKTLTTLTYAEISPDGKILADISYGRAPALSVMDAVHGDGVTYVFGYNAPSLFSDNPDTWVAAIETGGKLLWRKPVAEEKIGRVELFIDAAGGLFMVGYVAANTTEVGVIPWSSEGVMGKAQVFGSIEYTGWTYPDQLVRDASSGDIEMLFARSSNTEVRLDRLGASKNGNWTASLPWSQSTTSAGDRPTTMEIMDAGNGEIVLVGHKGLISLQTNEKRWEKDGLHSWIVQVISSSSPSLQHVSQGGGEKSNKIVNVRKDSDGSLIVFSNRKIREVIKVPGRNQNLGTRQTITAQGGQSTVSDFSSYPGYLLMVNDDDTATPVLFGQRINENVGKKAGYAFVLQNSIMVGTNMEKMFGESDYNAFEFFSFFEDIEYSKRIGENNIVVVSTASSRTARKGPIFRVFRVTPGEKE